MDRATNAPRPSAVTAMLAGLQAGMLGVCWMLAWLGVSAKLGGRSFWTAENLMASVFYGDRAIHSGFASITFSGLALYLVLYSSLGAVFALLLANRLTRFRTLLVSLLFAMSWYYLSFRVFGKSVAPLVTLLHSEQPMVLGHLVFGTFLGRYPVYLPQPPAPPAEGAAESPAPPADTTAETTDAADSESLAAPAADGEPPAAERDPPTPE